MLPDGINLRDLFQEAVQDRVDAFMDGAGVVLLNYGSPSGGASYLMQGSRGDPGLLTRVFMKSGLKMSEHPFTHPERLDEIIDLTEVMARKRTSWSPTHELLPHLGSPPQMLPK
ncbi:hypothetical protein HPB50_015678 [Hyalomma asiaticum]|uniref:Uncharacterized protein n=1 Tax=Hyalomma asiaticum TaxID=266040 RepID=A0ACB7RJ10_HYAAI|nr:hypothetical protein HPB50_015678 [Hyalomma asiaticum]